MWVPDKFAERGYAMSRKSFLKWRVAESVILYPSVGSSVECGGKSMSVGSENKEKGFFMREWEKLSEVERKVVEALLKKEPISKDAVAELEDDRTFGQKVADLVAAFGGSWTFIGFFMFILLTWVAVNSLLLVNKGFDPYPYILLNLFLSMIAAIQAPIIMMSQNRQAARDRADAAHDYEVNLKAELEIRHIHDKLDELRETKWAELVIMQQEQIRLLQELLAERTKSRD